MTFSVSKRAALSVKELTLEGPGISGLPLKAVTMSMGIDTPCVCTCEPVIGYDRLNGKKADPKVIEKLDPTKRYSIRLNIRSSGDIGGNKSTMFVGRPMGSGMNMATNPLGSSVQSSITLQHVAHSDLGGVAIGQRSYYRYFDHIIDFRMNPNSESNMGNIMLDNKHLAQHYIAWYLKDLCDALAKWYMNNGWGTGIDVGSILKAVPCVVKESITSVVTRGDKGSVNSVAGCFRRAVETAFNGAAARKASLMSILSTLSSFGMLTLVPTSRTLVITPRLDVCRWSKKTGVTAHRSDVTTVDSVTTIGRLPVEVVALNKRFGASYLVTDGANPNIHGLTSWGSNFIYPRKKTNMGVLIVDPPAIISGLLDTAANIATVGEALPSIYEGGYGTTRNTSGATPLLVASGMTKRLGDAAAQLMWCKFAFANRSATLSLLPHWVFSKSFDSDVHAQYETGEPWSLLGKELKFTMPYDTDGGSSKDVTYIGYVKGMTVMAHVEGPALSVTANLTNVRTEEEDALFAPYVEANPLYDNIDAKPV